jgi:Amt family ammonium transporter
MAVGVTIVYSGVVSFILLKVIGVMIPLRVSADEEAVGLDISNHGEEAYVQGEASSQMQFAAGAAKPSTVR